MRTKASIIYILPIAILAILTSLAFKQQKDGTVKHMPKAVITPSTKFSFNSFVDCNMAEAWVGDTFRIFPGKYGEDPLWAMSLS